MSSWYGGGGLWTRNHTCWAERRPVPQSASIMWTSFLEETSDYPTGTAKREPMLGTSVLLFQVSSQQWLWGRDAYCLRFAEVGQNSRPSNTDRALRSLPGVKRGGPRNASPRERGPDWHIMRFKAFASIPSAWVLVLFLASSSFFLDLWLNCTDQHSVWNEHGFNKNLQVFWKPGCITRLPT